MKDPKEMVRDLILKSAKTRFDYQAYRAGLGDLADDLMADNILDIVMARHATGVASEDIAAEIEQQLLLIGIAVEKGGFDEFVENMKIDFRREIKAITSARAGFEMGLQGPGILLQVRSLLAG